MAMKDLVNLLAKIRDVLWSCTQLENNGVWRRVTVHGKETRRTTKQAKYTKKNRNRTEATLACGTYLSERQKKLPSPNNINRERSQWTAPETVPFRTKMQENGYVNSYGEEPGAIRACPSAITPCDHDG